MSTAHIVALMAEPVILIPLIQKSVNYTFNESLWGANRYNMIRFGNLYVSL